jgi:prephenate dehydratase
MKFHEVLADKFEIFKSKSASTLVIPDKNPVSTKVSPTVDFLDGHHITLEGKVIHPIVLATLFDKEEKEGPPRRELKWFVL